MIHYLSVWVCQQAEFRVCPVVYVVGYLLGPENVYLPPDRVD